MTYNDSTNRDEEEEEELRTDIALKLAIGFEDDDDIIGEAASMYGLDEDEVLPYLREAKRAFDIERAAWSEVTDCDRLDNAMIDLDREGIFSRHCLKGGFPEMMELMWEARMWGRKIIGHVSYGPLGVEEALKTGTLSLVYRSTSHSTSNEIGQRIVQTLSTHGLIAFQNVEFEVVEVSLRWQRRGLPATSSERWTPQLALEHWCREIGNAVASSRANELGMKYGQALAAVGYHDVARTWAHALSEQRQGEISRTKGLRAIAAALVEADPKQAQCLLAEAYSVAPYGGSTDLLQLLIEGELFIHDEVRTAAHLRVLQARRDMLGAAEMAWYLVREAPALDDEDTLKRYTWFATQAFESPLEGEYLSIEALRVAAAAGLWVVHTRSRNLDLAYSALDIARESLKSLTASKVGWLYPIAAQALAQAAIELDAFDPLIASLVQEFIDSELPGDSELRGLVRRALLRSGQTEAARGFADPLVKTAAQRRAQLEADEPMLAESYINGLLTDSEVTAARLELAVLREKSGDHTGARQQFALVCDNHIWDYSGPSDNYLAGVVATGQTHLKPDTLWFTPAGERKLARALRELESRPNANMPLWRVLEAAAAFAHCGDVKRARELFSHVDPARYDKLFMDSRALAVRALVYLGEIEQATQVVDGFDFDHSAAWPLIVYLAENGKRHEALEYLGRIAERSISFHSLLALAPAIVAIAPESVSFATTMSRALDAAYAKFVSLRLATS